MWQVNVTRDCGLNPGWGKKNFSIKDIFETVQLSEAVD